MSKVAKQLHPDWEKIRDLRNEGKMMTDIAEIVGVPKGTVEGEIKKLIRRGILVPGGMPIVAELELFTKEPDPFWMQHKCNYPDCKQKQAGYSWALVPLCYKHFELIRKETAIYYNKRIVNGSSVVREHYQQISDMIAFASKGGA